MKKLLCLVVLMTSMSITAQTKTELLKHFEGYYKQMKSQGDVQGVINAMTHINVLQPSQQRLDTLAYIYVSEGRSLEALNTIGIENNPTDSNMNTEVKALALKTLNQPERALVFFEVLFQKVPNPYLAYDIADLKTQTKDLAGAKASVDYGLANVKPEMKKAYYETQQPYEVSMKGALTYLKAIILFNINKVDNLDQAIGLLDQALAMDANFNLAEISKNALVAMKTPKKE
jgi:tetratricopeptide (TPR) repeat protein